MNDFAKYWLIQEFARNNEGFTRTQYWHSFGNASEYGPFDSEQSQIYDNDKIIGRTTSGNYSFCFNKNLSFGYIFGENIIDIEKKSIFIEIEKYKYKASIITKPLNNKNIKII